MSGKIEGIKKLKVYLNSKHSTINFAFEIDTVDKMPSLDIQIERKIVEFKAIVYRKASFTGQYTYYECFLPSVYRLDYCQHFCFDTSQYDPILQFFT